jgi:hypothetical protein
VIEKGAMSPKTLPLQGYQELERLFSFSYNSTCGYIDSAYNCIPV